jgi:hypothetical protein
MMVDTDLYMAGYSVDQAVPLQKRMTDAMGAIPGVESVGLAHMLPLDDQSATTVFKDNTTDLVAANVVAQALKIRCRPVSPHCIRARLASAISDTIVAVASLPFPRSGNPRSYCF